IENAAPPSDALELLAPNSLLKTDQPNTTGRGKRLQRGQWKRAEAVGRIGRIPLPRDADAEPVDVRKLALPAGDERRRRVDVWNLSGDRRRRSAEDPGKAQERRVDIVRRQRGARRDKAIDSLARLEQRQQTFGTLEH